MPPASVATSFLKSTYSLQNSKEVEQAKNRRRKIEGHKMKGDTDTLISNYLQRFEDILNAPNNSLEENKKNRITSKEKSIKAFKRRLFSDVIIKPEEIPENYWKLQEKIIIERGLGAELVNGRLPENVKKPEIERILTEQKSSLSQWIDYLSDETAQYDIGLKYWALRSIIGLQSYDKEKSNFPKRAKGSVSNFPELNREALAYTLGFILSKIKGENIKKPHEGVNQEKFEEILKKQNFGDIYAFAIQEVTKSYGDILKNTNGEWKKYDKGTDHMPLVETLSGRATGWCTAAEATAKLQLQGGDFYVYYSQDENGKNTIPRLAIRMEGSEIAEIRGIADNQNFDPYIQPVLENKLKGFGEEGRKYEKKNNDMKRLTEIDNKLRENPDVVLSREDLMFLYEIDYEIEGFGYQKDPRIKNIKNSRNIKKDLSGIFGYKEEEISLNPEEALKGGIKYHYGDLNLSGVKSLPEGVEFPENVKSLGLYLLESIPERIKFPESLERLYLSGLESIPEGIKFPESLKYLDLSGLESIPEGIKFPESLEYLNLSGLKNIPEGIKFPESLKYLDLGGLESIPEGIKFPESLEWLGLRGLKSIPEGIKFPENLKDLDLSGLKSLPEGIKFPENLKYLDLLQLQNLPKGLKFPKSLKGKIFISSGLQEKLTDDFFE